MKFEDIKSLDEDSKIIAHQLDSYREVYNDIELEVIYEPLQIREVSNGKMKLVVDRIDDIQAWQKEIAYGCIVKMRFLEESIIKLIDSGDLYASSILMRQHMEFCGLLALSLEKLVDSLKRNNFKDLEKYMAQTWFGTSYYNNPKLRNSPEADNGIETVRVSQLIKALDKFVLTYKDKEIESEPNIFVHNYAWFCQMVHPNAHSCCLFTETTEVEEGHYVQFKWIPDFGPTGMISTLKMLLQNLRIGLTCYFTFMSYEILDDGMIEVNDSKLKYAFYKVLHRFSSDL